MPTRLILCCLLLALGPLLPAQQVYQGKARPVIERVELTDGRVLEQAQILGDSAHTVTIRHGSRVEKIEKKLLPPPLAAQWPVDLARAAREESDARQAAARRAKDLEQAARLAERVRQENIREAAESARRNAHLDAERAKKAADDAKLAADQRAVLDQLRLRAREGVFLGAFGRVGGPDGVRVTVRNLDDGHRRLDWRQIRGLTADGKIVPATDVVFTLRERVSYDLSGGERRAFRLEFKRHDIVALGWADREDLGWSSASAERVEAAAALEAERERRAAARIAERQSKLQPVRAGK